MVFKQYEKQYIKYTEALEEQRNFLFQEPCGLT